MYFRAFFFPISGSGPKSIFSQVDRLAILVVLEIRASKPLFYNFI